VAEVVVAEGFLEAGLAAVAAVRSRVVKIDEQKQNLTTEARGDTEKTRSSCKS
jgi:hypothetical protein